MLRPYLYPKVIHEYISIIAIDINKRNKYDERNIMLLLPAARDAARLNIEHHLHTFLRLIQLFS